MKPGGDAKPENPANPETPKPVDPANPANPANPGTEDLPADARDGIIEDLVGVIEVMPTVTTTSTATSAQ